MPNDLQTGSDEDGRSSAARIPGLTLPSWAERALGSVDGSGVRVAFVDSGWDYTLATNQVRLGRGESFLESATRTDLQDRHGHGTECLGLAAAMAPRAEFTPVRIFGATLTTSVTTLMAALRWTIERRFDVISLSLGCDEESAVVPMYSLCERAREVGTLIVASMDPSGSQRFPAAFDNVLSVQSGRDGGHFDFEYVSEGVTECFIGSKRIPVVSLGGTRSHRTGASFATPQLAGLAALFRQARPAHDLAGFRAFLAAHSMSARDRA